MKTRVGFVSNSSSSSFLCTKRPEGCNSVKVTSKTALNAIREVESNEENITVPESREYYVTEFVLDSDYKAYASLCDCPECFVFMDGSLDKEPYDVEDRCYRIENEVYLPKE